MRGNVRMKIGAGEHMLAPTFEAYRQIEERLNSTVPQLYSAHVAGALKLEEMALIVAIGMNEAAPGAADIHDVATHLFSQGVASIIVARPIAEYLLALGWSPEDARKKLAAEWGGESDEAATAA